MNYYEQPVVQTFMDTYAPLPFQEMMAVGQAYKTERDKTEAAMNQYKSEYGDFSSLSSEDVSAWNREAFGWYDDKLREMSGDSDKIKSPEFQAAIRRGINSVNSNYLSALRHSAENLSIRAKNVEKMKAEGLYKESWDDLADLSTWQTIGPNGDINIMSDLTPVSYKSLHDIATPYVQDLKPSFLGKKDRYTNIIGIDDKAIAASLEPSYGEIFNSPQGQMWMRDIRNEMAASGVEPTEEAVKAELSNRLVHSQKDRRVINFEYDKAAMQQDELALKRRQYEANAAANKPAESYNLLDMVEAAGERKLKQDAMSSYLGDNEATAMTISTYESEIAKATESGDSITATKLEKELDAYIGKYNQRRAEFERRQQAIDIAYNKGDKKMYDAAVKSAKEYQNSVIIEDRKEAALTAFNNSVIDMGPTAVNSKGEVSPEVANYASENALEGISNDISTAQANTIISRSAANPDAKLDKGAYVYTSAEGLLSPAQAASSLNLLDIKDASNFKKYMNSGAIREVEVFPSSKNSVVSLPQANGKIKQMLKVTVRIYEDQIDKSKLPEDFNFDESFNALNPTKGTVTITPGKESTSMSSKIKSSGTIDPKTTVTTSTEAYERNYLDVSMYQPIPSKHVAGEEAFVYDINMTDKKKHASMTQSGDERSTEVEKSFGLQ